MSTSGDDDTHMMMTEQRCCGVRRDTCFGFTKSLSEVDKGQCIMMMYANELMAMANTGQVDMSERM